MIFHINQMILRAHLTRIQSTASDSSTGGSHSTDLDDSLDQCEGYRIIDLPSLEQVLGKAAMCCKCQGKLQIEESSSARQGLASHLQICCTQCDSRHTCNIISEREGAKSTRSPSIATYRQRTKCNEEILLSAEHARLHVQQNV